IGTAFRQGALAVTQMDIRPQPPKHEDKMMVWPYWPTKMRTSSSQAEGADRQFAAATLELIGRRGRVTHVKCARVDEKRLPIPGTEFLVRADLVLVAIGFAGPASTFADEFGGALKTDRRTNVVASTDDYLTSVPKLY